LIFLLHIWDILRFQYLIFRFASSSLTLFIYHISLALSRFHRFITAIGFIFLHWLHFSFLLLDMPFWLLHFVACFSVASSFHYWFRHISFSCFDASFVILFLFSFSYYILLISLSLIFAFQYCLLIHDWFHYYYFDFFYRVFLFIIFIFHSGFDCLLFSILFHSSLSVSLSLASLFHDFILVFLASLHLFHSFLFSFIFIISFSILIDYFPISFISDCFHWFSLLLFFFSYFHAFWYYFIFSLLISDFHIFHAISFHFFFLSSHYAYCCHLFPPFCFAMAAISSWYFLFLFLYFLLRASL